MKIIEDLKNLDLVYIIGHDNIDADSYFSSYVLSRILRRFGINAYFTILDNYTLSLENKELIEDYVKEKPFILKIEDINNKNFILVDHNDIAQSLKNNNCNVIFAIDHHIDTKTIKNCYTKEYTSTLLYIYDMFKKTYKFNKFEKDLIALSVMADSEYLTSSRFKESDKILYDELNVDLDVNKIRDKYFKTTDFNLDINYNIKSNYKLYNIENHVINRVILKGYSKDKNYLDIYLKEINDMYDNSLVIWIEYDTKKTYVYYKEYLFKVYDYVLTSSVLIINDLLEKEKWNTK